MRAFGALLMAVLMMPQLAHGQRASSVLAAKPGAAAGAGAFVIEGFGATAGSFAGMVAVVLATRDDCDVEDLSCNLGNAGLGLLTSTAGAALGATLAGNLAATEPSGWGAIVGAVAGSVAGIGVWHLVTEELNISRSRKVAVASYSLTQGVVTALGSRIGAALRK